MRRIAILLLTILPLTACSDNRPTPPTEPSPPPAAPPTNPPPAPTAPLTRVWLCCGSNQVILNSQRQVELWATYADGTNRDVTSEATGWKSSKPNVAPITDKGMLRGLAEGDFEVTASYQGILATWGMYVRWDFYRPPDTREVTGTVREITPFGEMYVWKAEVEVVGGPHNGLKVQTSTGGLFRLTDLQAPGFELIVRDAAYSTKRFRVDRLGIDVSDQTIMTPAPTMVSEVFEGPVCWPTNTIRKTFTPANAGILRITSSAWQSTSRELYEDGTLVQRWMYNNEDYPIRAGANYEFRATGSCDYHPSINVRMTLLRPR